MKTITGDNCMSLMINEKEIEITFDVVSSFVEDNSFDYEDGTGRHTHTPHAPFVVVEEIEVMTVVVSTKDGIGRDKKAPKRVAAFIKNYIQDSYDLMEEVSEIYSRNCDNYSEY